MLQPTKPAGENRCLGKTEYCPCNKKKQITLITLYSQALHNFSNTSYALQSLVRDMPPPTLHPERWHPSCMLPNPMALATLHLIIITGGWVSGVRRVAQGGGAESSCVEPPQLSLLRGVDLDSQTGLDGGGHNYGMQSTYIAR